MFPDINLYDFKVMLDLVKGHESTVRHIPKHICKYNIQNSEISLELVLSVSYFDLSAFIVFLNEEIIGNKKEMCL